MQLIHILIYILLKHKKNFILRETKHALFTAKDRLQWNFLPRGIFTELLFFLQVSMDYLLFFILREITVHLIQRFLVLFLLSIYSSCG